MGTWAALLMRLTILLVVYVVPIVCCKALREMDNLNLVPSAFTGTCHQCISYRLLTLCSQPCLLLLLLQQQQSSVQALLMTSPARGAVGDQLAGQDQGAVGMWHEVGGVWAQRASPSP